MFELPGSRIESGMTAKNKYSKVVINSIFVLNRLHRLYRANGHQIEHL
jgi:hypothetical protein